MIIKDAVTGKIKKVDVDDMAEVTPTYRTIEWANREIEAGDKHYLAVARWIWEESQEWGLSLSATIKQLVEQGLKINYKTAHRWINEIPEYKQLQQEKKANPSSDALRMRKNYQPKNSQNEKPSPVIPEWSEEKEEELRKYRELKERLRLNEEKFRKRLEEEREEDERKYQEALASEKLNEYNSYSAYLFTPKSSWDGDDEQLEQILVPSKLFDDYKKLAIDDASNESDSVLMLVFNLAKKKYLSTNKESKTRSNAERFFQEAILPTFSIDTKFLDAVLRTDDDNLKAMLREGVDYEMLGYKFTQLGKKIKKLRVK
ncbi:MAG: hypothetical protein CLLPBCKN_003355 [Chroococcidiopsis cubana SAG 39.79]|uniref:hypothetical protein n=1 Tax=Chroococcidiopsis cubana TaxID=171392 RepID=UPI000D055C2F|nr:hypothetical protein [Chroococcidiopsis cubana]MDZ4873959.1 hypothetical protein [Chroococcidiopsis cubana SAG 39.79]PSB59679.1 hypothetical protein C7B79_28615 [Chroococcidiopsis cubana CCALA 043]